MKLSVIERVAYNFKTLECGSLQFLNGIILIHIQDRMNLISFVVSLHISDLNTGSFVMVEIARAVRVLE